MTVLCDDGVRLHVEVDFAPGSGVSMVFVHGIASGLQEFAEQRSAFSGTANLVLYNQRGHGDDDADAPSGSQSREVTIDRLARDLATVIEETTRPDERLILVTHSLGGMVALAFITEHPELVGTRIAGIALISTAATRIPEVAAPRPVAITLVRSHLAHALLGSMAWSAPALDVLKPSLSWPGRWWLRYMMFGRDWPPEQLLQAKQALWARTSAAVVASAYDSLLTFDRTEALEILRRIPVLIVTGTSDRTIPARRSRHLAARIGANAALLTVPRAGHTVNQTHSSLVNKALRTLLNRSTQ